MLDRFTQPVAQFGNQNPDIAIRQIDPDFVTHIGKEALDLDNMKDAPEDIDHAIVVGFPEKLKTHKFIDSAGYSVSMPQIEILVELSSRPDSRFTLFSELEKPGVLTESDFSVELLLPKRNKNEAGAGYGKNWSSN